MSTSGRWREDQILVICPGSHTTTAQLGCNELTTPQHRFPTRVFWDDVAGAFRPVRTFRRRRDVPAVAGVDGDDEEWEWVEDPDSVEGAVYPLVGGHIVNMKAFLAFVEHVHGTLAAVHHNTPIIMMAPPQWTRRCCETITRYVFERTRTPAFCLINSAVAAHFGTKWPSAAIVDIGYEKVDVTCIHEGNVVSHTTVGRAPSISQDDSDDNNKNETKVEEGGDVSGGQYFSNRLLEKLAPLGFTPHMVEQLKKSDICEVLPFNPLAPLGMTLPDNKESSPIQPKPSVFDPITAAPSSTTNPTNGDKAGDDEGVLDVAAIVATGQTHEFLAKNKAKTGRRAKDKDKDGAKDVELTNAQKATAVFTYDEFVEEEVQIAIPAPTVEGLDLTAPNATAVSPLPESSIFKTEKRTKRVQRNVEVGLERFTFADRAELDRIADAIYRTIQRVPATSVRAECWDHLVFIGNGARLKGLRENLLQTLNYRHLVYPSSASIFLSEFPSGPATPSGTQTPTSVGGPGGNYMGGPSGVNPLLHAATAAAASAAHHGSTPIPNPTEALLHAHKSRGQTPTSIKLAALPAYLAAWAAHGFEEVTFLGCLIAARLAFCQSSSDHAMADAQRQMSLSRPEYNEIGPRGVRTNSMLG